MKPVSVVIPAYRRENVLSTVPFLQGQRYGDELRIVVVDNGNPPELSARLRGMTGPHVKVISFPENRGGSAAYIAGVEYAMREHLDSDAVWLLDDDAVPDSETLPGLYDALAARQSVDAKVACMGSTIVDAAAPDRVVETGAKFSVLLGRAFGCNAGKTVASLPGGVVPVDYCAGCSVLIPKAVITSCGFWEDVFIHFDDVEWGLRAKRRFGYRSFATTSSLVRHPRFDPEKAGAWICYFDARNMYWLAEKYGFVAVLCARAKNWMKDMRARLAHWHPERVPYRRLAYADFVKGIRRSRSELEATIAGGCENSGGKTCIE